jgi:alkyl hydroperoxide reductase subunit AhpC
MGRTAQLADEFASRGVKPIGLSTDTVGEHIIWIEDVDDTQSTTLRFPIVADADLKIAKLYNMTHPSESETAAVRSVFIIDPDKKIRLTMTYPMNVGRNLASHPDSRSYHKLDRSSRLWGRAHVAGLVHSRCRKRPCTRCGHAVGVC